MVPGLSHHSVTEDRMLEVELKGDNIINVAKVVEQQPRNNHFERITTALHAINVGV